MKRILIIAPHADDEVIGCGGVIGRAHNDGDDVTLVVMATGGVKHNHLTLAASTEERLGEISASCALLGIARWRVLFPGQDMALEGLSMRELVTALDEVMSDQAFDECYLPEPTHNLDHRLTHEAAIAALRFSDRQPVSHSLVYEGTVARWHSPAEAGGKLYVNIESTLEMKVNALRAYRSQIRPYPHPTSEEAVRRLAAMRGLEAGLVAAERFQILRSIRR